MICSTLVLFAHVIFCHSAQASVLVATGSEIKIVSDDGVFVRTFVEGATYGMFYDSANQYLYYTGTGDSIWRADRDGTNTTQIVSNAGDVVVDLVIDQTNNKIIWTDFNNSRIRRSNLDGTNIEDIVTGVSTPHGMQIDQTSGYIYWSGDQQIYRANLNGTGQTTILTDDDTGLLPFFTIVGNKVYWSNFINSRIKRANLDGTNIETVASGSTTADVEGVTFSSNVGKLIFVGAPNLGATLRKVDPSGGTVFNINTTFRGYDVIADYSKRPGLETISKYTRFFTSYIESSGVVSQPAIYVMLSSNSVVKVAQSPDVTKPYGIVYSTARRKMYWIDGDSNAIRRADPEGNQY